MFVNDKMEQHLHHLVASSLAVCIAEVSTLPICTLKTKHQTQSLLSPNKILNYKNIYDISTTLGSILSANGIRGLYQARYPAVLSQVISTSSKYTLYRVFQSKSNDKTFITNVGLSISSGLIVSLVTHPIDVCRVIIQNNANSTEQKSMRIALIGRRKQSLYRFFYRGYSKTIAKQIIGSTLFFPIYDWCRGVLGDKDRDTGDKDTSKSCCQRVKSNTQMKAALLSSTISTILIHPIDYLRTRSLAGVTNKEMTFRGMYRGLSLNLSRIVPHFTIMMSLTEYIKKYL